MKRAAGRREALGARDSTEPFATPIDTSATVRRFTRSLRPHSVALLLYFTLVVGASLLSLLGPLLFRGIVDTAIPQRNRGLVVQLSLEALLAGMLASLLALGAQWIMSGLVAKVFSGFSVAAYDHVQRLPVSFFKHTKSGALLSRLHGDIARSQALLSSHFGTAASNAVGLVGALVLMLALDWRATLYLLLVVPVLLVPSRWVASALRENAKLTSESSSRGYALSAERLSVGGNTLVKLFGAYNSEKRAFALRTGELNDLNRRRFLLSTVFATTTSTVTLIALGVLFCAGALGIIAGTGSIGSLTALLLYMQRLYQPLASFASLRIGSIAALAALERVFELIDYGGATLPASPVREDGGIPKAGSCGEWCVTFERVHFGYPDPRSCSPTGLVVAREPSDFNQVDVLRGVSFVARSRETTAIVGSSGAGKSTIAALICGQYGPTSGRILIGQRELGLWDQEALMSNIGVVPQDVFLLHETIETNLMFANSAATKGDLVRACEIAGIHRKIVKLGGYDTVVGERGYSLSGGERQRIAIARMILKNPALVILDEATSHLDAATEHDMKDAMAEALAGRTVIIIAHRPSTIDQADQVVILDLGVVALSGRPDSIRRSSEYQALFRGLAEGRTRRSEGDEEVT